MCIAQFLRKVVGSKFLLLCCFQAAFSTECAQEVSETSAERPLQKAVTGGSAYLQSAGAHYRNGSYREAVANYLEALRYFQPAGEVDSLVAIFNGLGGVYAEMEEFEQSAVYYKRAIRFAEHTGNLSDRALTYTNVGTVYRRLDSNEMALKYLDKGLDLARQIGDQRRVAQGLLNIGNVQLKLDDLDGALESYQASLAICGEMGVDFGTMINHINIGRLHLQTKNYVAAKVSYDSAMVYAQRLELPYEETKLHEHLAALYTETGDYQTALTYFKTFHEKQSQLVSEEKQKAIAELEVKYETALKDREIELVSRKLKQKRMQNQALISVVILIVLATGLGVFFMLYRHRTLRMLYSRNVELLNALKLTKLPGKSSDAETENGRDGMLRAIFDKLLALMEQDGLYKNPDLTIREVTGKLLTNEKYVSLAIATHGKMNYNNFVNFYRINEAKRLILESAQTTSLNEVMYACGFNSRTTFYNAFNKFTGMSPKQFKQLTHAPAAMPTEDEKVASELV